MLDNQGRNIRYLRLSVTDRGNFRCRYCMPAEGVCKREHSEMLSFEELTEIVQTAVSLGVSKVRLTGGEPLVRRGIVDLCRSLRAINGVRELAMTTNGALLPQYAAELKQAGVDRLNISLDTLNEDKFASLTRGGSLADTLAGLDAAWNAGFCGTKLNAVLLGCRTDFECSLLAAAHAASALILKRGQSHLFEPCRRILAFLEACGGKRLRVARRTEFRLSHDVLSPPFCAVRAR